LTLRNRLYITIKRSEQQSKEPSVWAELVHCEFGTTVQ
jgi:hypothetical protein